MISTFPPEQLPLPLEPSVIEDLTPEQRGQTLEALALLFLTAVGAPAGEIPDET
ncbi:MAG: hypothetical protein ACK5LJ_05805 [Paracoccus sp. (in: a-proteobacteria)]